MSHINCTPPYSAYVCFGPRGGAQTWQIWPTICQIKNLAAAAPGESLAADPDRPLLGHPSDPAATSHGPPTASRGGRKKLWGKGYSVDRGLAEAAEYLLFATIGTDGVL